MYVGPYLWILLLANVEKNPWVVWANNVERGDWNG